MKERTRRILIMAVMAALIVSLMAASLSCIFTYGRYTGGRFDENSPYDDFIDFVGATAFTVQTPEELTNAINNGYSYIKIAADAEEPFVVNDDIANVTTNLVLDVNGTTVIRNSRNPLLDVKRSVSVVLVYDSSTEQAGGFYNPVGSALQTSGGTLTVGAGVYESGPNEEYQTESYQTGQQVTLFTRTDRTGPYPETGASVKDLPILTGKNVGTPEDPVSVYDYYFEIAPEGNVNPLIEDDTYLIYTKESNCYEKDGQLLVNCTKTETEAGTEISGTSFSVESNVASCDFYYYYPVNGTAGTADAFQEYAVVYGYHDVKALARDEKKTDENGTEYGMASALTGSGLVWPYAAIRSEAGNTFARGGAFTTHFGEENTYCIYSAGGTMTVGGTATPTFSAVQSGVCIKMEGQETEEQRSSLTINSGDFSSEIGNTIEMSGGEMEVKQGKFTKTGCKKGTDAQLENQTAIISLTGGTLNVSGTKTGDTTYSVTMTAGGTENGGTLENVFGILARGGEVSVGGCTLNIYGDYSAGVLSYDGTINLNDKTSITVTQSDTNKDNNNNTLLTSSAVSSEAVSSEASGEEHPINMSGNVTIESNGLGITARGTVNVTEGATTTVKASRGTGIYVNNGTFTVESDAKISVESTVLAGYAWGLPPEGQGTAPNIYNGVYVQGGSLISNGTLNVTFTGVQNDNIEYDLSGTVFAGTGLTYDSQNRNEYYDPALNIIEEYTDIYQNFQTKSYAVRVEGTENTKVTIAEGNITNSVGGGVLVKGGKVYLGATVTLDDSGKVTNATPAKKPVSVSTTGNTAMEGRYITRAYRTGSGSFFDPYRYRVQLSSYIGISGAADNWAYRLSSTGGDAVKVDGGSLTVYGGEYHAAQGNGILVKTGTASVKGGTFDGGNGYNAVNTKDDFVAGAGVSYGFKLLGGSLTVENGLFESDSGGAFAMQGTVTFNGGKIDASGATGFSAWEGANVTFNSTSVEISVRGTSTGLAIETNTTTVPEVTINGGRFSGDQDGIWYGNGNAALTITGGNFTGNNRSGLYFDVVPSGNNVHLSGGTYYGKPEEHGVRHWYGNGAIGAEVGGTIYDLRNGNGYDIKLNNILGNESSIIESGSGKTYPRNNDALCDTVSSEEWVKIG